MTKVYGASSTPVVESYDRVIAGLITLDGSAQQVRPNPSGIGHTCIQSDPGNANDVYVGSAITQSFVLGAGESVTIAADPVLIYVRGTASDAVNWLAVG